jgi:acetyltransferase-like isoleucine patch superfamily enzyme
MNAPNLKRAVIVDVTCGRNVTIVEPANVYGCTLGDDVFVGPFVEIQTGVRVGARSRIQSHSFVCELVEIGEDSVIAHGVMFINDPFAIGGPAKGRRDLWKSTRVGARVSIGSNATVLPVSICDDVVIGAGAVVTRDITQPGVYAGNPARLLRRLGAPATRTQPT